MTSMICLQAQTTDKNEDWLGEFKVGIRTQKTQKLYWENDLTVNFTSPKIMNNRVHLGFSYVTTRLGSAMGTNAIKQDNFLLNMGYFFRPQKKLQPFARINTGFFYADYEAAIFDELPNTAVLFSVDAGLAYKFDAPFTVHLSVGYNLNTGTGADGPGTLYPVYYQMSIFYTLFKNK
ncbi:MULTISPECIES: hypothetical protein [unclassified Polaribacter]|uniref:hypothetical protein n=1 Tax=unclassified Polaribacter TaxID=196858 RepID=UPI0011BE0976|nr:MULTISPECIES: hypothetical protein [unclassified Polaribacter]TXD50613.1 hypothetical protein ES043_15305 [Polaribacter sp. IC063]TXD57276.1 hypothetical protein ES044_15325 [Polaribacter sp. IC066]